MCVYVCVCVRAYVRSQTKFQKQKESWSNRDYVLMRSLCNSDVVTDSTTGQECPYHVSQSR